MNNNPLHVCRPVREAIAPSHEALLPDVPPDNVEAMRKAMP